MLRKQLINTIATCNNKEVRKKWIIELSNMDNIECTESQCYSCPISEECVPIMDELYNTEGGCLSCQI